MRPAMRFAALFVFLAGCGSPSVIVLKSATTTAIAAAGCYRLIDGLDAAEQTKIRNKAKGGDPNGAQKDLDAWLPKYDAVFKTCQAAHLGAAAALAAVPAIDKGLKGEKSPTAWAGMLVKLAADAAAALDSVGIKLGGAP